MTQKEPSGTRQNGFAIRDLRIKEGLTVQELANVLGMSYSHLQNIEHENRSARPEHITAIAKALNCRTASIVRFPADECEAVPA
jgi:transcriptional regulator with XRE-family HTH domain